MCSSDMSDDRGQRSHSNGQSIQGLLADLCRCIKASASNSWGEKDCHHVGLKELKQRAFATLLRQTSPGVQGGPVEMALSRRIWPIEDVLKMMTFEVNLHGRKEDAARLEQCLMQLRLCTEGVQSFLLFLLLLSENCKRNSTDVMFCDELFCLPQNIHSQNANAWFTEYSSKLFESMRRVPHQESTHLPNVFDAVPGFNACGNQLFESFGDGDGHKAQLPLSSNNLNLPALTPLTWAARYRMRHRFEEHRFEEHDVKPKESSSEPQGMLPIGHSVSAAGSDMERKVLLQHVVYLLAGIPSDSFIWDEERFVPRQGLHTKGVSEHVLLNTLTDFLQCGADVRCLEKWSKEIGGHGGLVLEAFRNGLRRYLHSYHGTLICVTHNLEQMTLLHLRHLTSKAREEIRFLASFCREVLHLDVKGTEVRGSELLGQLYWAAATGWCRRHYSLLLHLLYYASEPYCRFLQDWLFHGHYSNPFQEFPICMDNHLASIHDETFWLRTFALRPSQELPFLSHLGEKVLLCAKTVTLLRLCQPYKTTLWNDDSAPKVALTFSRELSQSIIEASKIYISKKWKELGFSCSEDLACNVEQGLQPAAPAMEEANPAVELAKATLGSAQSDGQNLLFTVSNGATASVVQSKATLTIKLKNEAQPEQHPKYVKCEGREDEKSKTWSVIPLPTLGSLPELDSPSKGYLISAYCTNLPRPGEMLLPLEGDLEAAPLMDLVEQSLLPPLKAQMQLVNRAAVEYFMHDLKLISHLQILGDFFCLQDGDFAQTLCSGICEKVTTCPSELLHRSTLCGILSGALAASLRSNSPYVSLLAMDARNIPGSFSSGENTLSCLILSYEVLWPLNLVITKSSLQRYNKVFHFLLQIQRAHWALKDVWFRIRPLATKGSNSNCPRLRKLHMIWHEMENFVQLLASHVNSQAVDVTLRELQNDLHDKVQTLDDIRRAHATCISRLGRRCLLIKRAAPIAKTLHDVLRCTLQLRTCVIVQPWVTQAPEAFQRVLRTHARFRDEMAVLCQALKSWGTSASLPWCTRLSSALIHGDYCRPFASEK